MNIEEARAIVDADNRIGPTSLRRIRDGETQMLSDKQLVRGAREAVRIGDLPPAVVALEELALRKQLDDIRE